MSAELPLSELFALIGASEHLTLEEVVDGLLALRGSSVRVHSLLLQQEKTSKKVFKKVFKNLYKKVFLRGH